MTEKAFDLITTNNKLIENCIFEIRGKQVMLDSDIARLFGVETKYINRQMKRNCQRFPEEFCFQLNSKEFKNLRCQNVTFKYSSDRRKYAPYAYTEHGIIALAGVIKNETAAKMSVEIVRKFVQMRKFILENGDTLLALAKLQNRQLEFENETNQKFDKMFELIDKNVIPKETIFYAGKYYDSYDFLSSLVSKVKESIVIVDPYADDKIFKYLKQKNLNARITLCISSKAKITSEVKGIFEKEYGPILVKTFDDIHDRYLLFDNDCYLLGTSLNYMGKICFLLLS